MLRFFILADNFLIFKISVDSAAFVGVVFLQGCILRDWGLGRRGDVSGKPNIADICHGAAYIAQHLPFREGGGRSFFVYYIYIIYFFVLHIIVSFN